MKQTALLLFGCGGVYPECNEGSLPCTFGNSIGHCGSCIAVLVLHLFDQLKQLFFYLTMNVHSFAVGGAILLRRPWLRVLKDVIKDKILFKSLIDKYQPVLKLNRITGVDRRFASPPAAAKLHVVGILFAC